MLSALAFSGAGMAQMLLGGTGFITVSVAGVAAVGGGMAGDARLPVTGNGATYDASSRRVSITAIGRRSAVRRIEVRVPNARAEQRIDLNNTTQATIQITLEGDRVLSAESGRGFVQFESLTPQRAVGRYEGTFQNGPTPMVVRGNFQVNLAVAAGTTPATPMNTGTTPSNAASAMATDAGAAAHQQSTDASTTRSDARAR